MYWLDIGTRCCHFGVAHIAISPPFFVEVAAILFVGYSFRDPNIAYLFRTVNEKFKNLPHSFAGKRAYIVVPNPSDFELQLFQERKLEVIPTLDLDRTRAVSDLLSEL